MTGPEHYATAEALLAEADAVVRPHDEGHCEADRTIAAAQVHATLALAAATALNDPRDGAPMEDTLAWQVMASEATRTRVIDPTTLN